MAVQFENWGESFWRSYHMAADAKSRRMEYAKWVQDKLDREQADAIIKSAQMPMQEIMAPVQEAQRNLVDLQNQRNAEIDQARATSSPEEFQKKYAEINAAYAPKLETAQNVRANLAMDASVRLQDTIMPIINSAGANPYVYDWANAVGKSALGLAGGVIETANQHLALSEQLSGNMAVEESRAARQTEAANRASELETQQTQNRMREIGASTASQLKVIGAREQSEKRLFDYKSKEGNPLKPVAEALDLIGQISELDPAGADKLLKSPGTQAYLAKIGLDANSLVQDNYRNVASPEAKQELMVIDTVLSHADRLNLPVEERVKLAERRAALTSDEAQLQQMQDYVDAIMGREKPGATATDVGKTVGGFVGSVATGAVTKLPQWGFSGVRFASGVKEGILDATLGALYERLKVPPVTRAIPPNPGALTP